MSLSHWLTLKWNPNIHGCREKLMEGFFFFQYTTNFELKLKISFWMSHSNHPPRALTFFHITDFCDIAQKMRLICCMCGLHRGTWTGFRVRIFVCMCFFPGRGSRAFLMFSPEGLWAALPTCKKYEYHTDTACNTGLRSSPWDVFPYKAERWQHKHQPAAALFSWPERTLKGKHNDRRSYQ